MQIPILNGIYTDENSDFRTSYPRNLTPVPKPQGISAGYLRPSDGIVTQGAGGPGIDRGGINWDGICYRAMGTKLVLVDSNGLANTLGEIGGSSQVSLTYSFDRLAVASNNNLFYWDGSTLTQVTDDDLGVVLDVVWVDGYFMTTDGTSLVVTDLTDPTSINPLRYGSSEVDPDPIKALLKVRNEVHALNRYTVEAFDNIGGSGFPFQRIDGAQLQRGTIGTHTCCVFLEVIAFIGGGRDESIAVWLGSGGSTTKISSREIDQLLAEYSESVLELAVMEPRVDKGHQFILIHLPDQTLVYDAPASSIVGEPVWHTLTTNVVGDRGQYLAKNLVWCYDKWLVGNPTDSSLGFLSDSLSSHWGAVNSWEFSTSIIYNEGLGAIFHELELVCLTGRAVLGDDPTIWTDYSTDGVTWSTPKPRKAGKQGERAKRIMWLHQGKMRNWRIQRFRGTSDAHTSMARLDAQVEGLAF